MGKLNRLILRCRKANILFIKNDAAAIRELFEDIDGAIGGCIIHHDDFLGGVSLVKDRFEAALDKAATVIGNDCDRNKIRLVMDSVSVCGSVGHTSEVCPSRFLAYLQQNQNRAAGTEASQI